MKYSRLWLFLVIMLVGCGTLAPTQETPSYRVTFALEAARFGDQSATVTVVDRAGTPMDNLQVVLTPTMMNMGMASPETVATSIGAGRYRAERTILFTMTGEWEITVRIDANGRSEQTMFTVQVRE
jgi:hypothetical protein